MSADSAPEVPEHHDALLTQHLRTFLGDIEPAALDLLRASPGRGSRSPGGQTLMDAGRARRLDVPVDQRPPARLRERRRRHAAHGARDGPRPGHRRDEPRIPTSRVRPRVVAIRDSVLVRLDKAHFDRAAGQQSAGVDGAHAADHPPPADRSTSAIRVPLPVTDQPAARVATACDRAALRDKARRANWPQVGRVRRGRLVRRSTRRSPSPASRDARCRRRSSSTGASRCTWTTIEAEHEFVLLVADATPSAVDAALLPPWRRAAAAGRRDAATGAAPDRNRLADAPPAAQPRPPRSWCCCTRQNRAARAAPRPGWRAGRSSSMCTSGPSWNATWLGWRASQSRTAVGLVLAGGGARGFAHLGVYRALQRTRHRDRLSSAAPASAR